MNRKLVKGIIVGITVLSTGLAGCGSNSNASGAAAKTGSSATSTAAASSASSSSADTANAEAVQAASTTSENSGSESVTASSGTVASTSIDTSDWEPIDVSIGVDSSTFSAQLRIADEAGLFDKYKINADLTSYSFGIDTINGVILNEVQVGEANDYAVATRAAESSNLRLVSSILSGHGDSKSLYVNKDEIKSGADLKGHNLAVQSGTVNEFEWAKTLDAYGLTKDDVNYLEFSSDAEALTAFQTGSADAIWLSKQFDDAANQVQGARKIANLGDIDQVNIAYLVVDNSFLESNEEAVERILLALNDATDIINNEPDKAAQYLTDSLGIAKEDAAKGLQTYDYSIEFSQKDVDHVLEVANWSIDNGLIEKAYDLSKYVVTDPLKAVLPDVVDFS